jgi:hypothetical protein
VKVELSRSLCQKSKISIVRHLEIPQVDLQALFLTCVGQKRASALKNRLAAAAAFVATEAAQYNALAQQMNLYQFQAAARPAGTASHRELADLYDSTFARKGGAGRQTYDAILNSPSNGICPFCGHGVVSTLDHYLPKRPFGVLAVIPINLVPACKDCNHAKGNIRPLTDETQPLHPYFDDYNDERWLQARSTRAPRVTIEFFVQEIGSWSEMRRRRIAYHFELFDLARLFSVQSAVELVNMRKRLRDLFAVGGRQVVTQHLAEEAASRRAVFLNSWQAALYDALAADALFCGGDFELT